MKYSPPAFTNNRFFCFMNMALPILAFFFTLQTTAQSNVSGLLVNADSMERNYKDQLFTLEGNVQVLYEQQYLFCDKAVIDLKTKKVKATGHVIFQTLKMYSESQELTYNLDTKLGIFYDGFIQSGLVVFEGKTIEKISEDEFIATKGHYTACRNCPRDWSFSSEYIEAKLGGYAYIKYPVLRIRNFPILILPGIWVPLKSQRQSGVLIPNWAYGSRSGFTVGQSYFWAISRSQDMTISAKHYEKLGFKSIVEYRYMLTPNSSGKLNSAYIFDREFESKTNSGADRAFVKYSHHYELPNDFIHRMDLNYATDLRYPIDFSDEMSNNGDPALENKTSLTLNKERSHFSMESDLYINLLKSDPLSKNRDAVHRFPEINYNYLGNQIGTWPLYWSLQFNYVNFSRRSFSYDDVNGVIPKTGTNSGLNENRFVEITHDGDFDPSNDLARTGHRVDITPELSFPFKLSNLFQVSPTLAYRETQYRFNSRPSTDVTGFSSNAARRYIKGDLSIATQFSRIYKKRKHSLSKKTSYKHVIEPKVTYSKNSFIRRPTHNFFGNFTDQPYSRNDEPISDDDFFNESGIQFDYKDRIFNKNLIDFQVTNRIIRKKFLDSRVDYLNIGTLKLSQSFDVNESNLEDASKQPWSTINALLDLRLDSFDTHTEAAYHPYARVTDISSRIRLKNEMGNFVEASFSRKFLIEANNKTSFSERTENWGLGIGWVHRLYNFVGRIKYSPVTSDIQSWEYIARIKPPGDCWSIQLGHKQVIGGDQQFKFDFSFSFGGDDSIQSTPPELSEAKSG